MTELLKQGHQGVVAKLCSLDIKAYISSISMGLYKFFNNHAKVFGEMPKGLTPISNHDHAIHFQPRSVLPNIRLYRYPHLERLGLTVWFKKCQRQTSFILTRVLSLHQW